MTIKIAKYPFKYWGDLHSQEWFAENRDKIPEIWTGIYDVGWNGPKETSLKKEYKGIYSFQKYLTFENKYVAMVKNLIEVFRIKRVAICYKNKLDIIGDIKVNISSNEIYNNVNCGLMFQLTRQDIYTLIKSYSGERGADFIFELLLRLGIRGIIVPFVLRDFNNRKTRIYVSDDMYIFAQSKELTSIEQLTIPKGLNVHRYTKGFPYG